MLLAELPSLVQAHTHGINWELVAVIVGPVSAVVGAVYRATKRTLGRIDGLVVKVDQVGVHLKRQDAAMRDQQHRVDRQHAELGEKVASVSDRLARVEGPR